MTSSATGDHSRDPAVSHEPEHAQITASTGSPDIISQKENASPVGGNAGSEPTAESTTEEVDEFGLPIRIRARPVRSSESSDDEEFHDVGEAVSGPGDNQSTSQESKPVTNDPKPEAPQEEENTKSVEKGKDAENGTQSSPAVEQHPVESPREKDSSVPVSNEKHATSGGSLPDHEDGPSPPPYTEKPSAENPSASTQSDAVQKKRSSLKASEWSHQRLYESKESEDEDEVQSDGGWQDMPAIDEFDVYDDFGRLVARGAKPEDNDAVYRGLGGAGKGYTRVQLDEDAQSATSLDEDTSYLFREAAHNSTGVEGEEELRDAVSQLQATKDLLTESQRIAYVGVARLAIFQMTKDLDRVPATKGTRKAKQKTIDSMRQWGQTIMARIYAHMDIDAAEQVMIEQLAEHGVQPADLVRPLMQNARVKNPLAEEVDTPKNSLSSPATPSLKDEYRSSLSSDVDRSTPPPPYETHEGEDLPEVRTPSQLPTSSKIDIDLRWTVLCDLFLVLIADSTYDARSRTLLEKVGESMEVSWLQIARFEKRVVDALEMQEQADKETWDESDHMEKRRKMALKRKYIVMGLATVGGGLVIGLSAGLLAPVIGAGLAAGFTTVGITGTGAFLGGVGGTAIIASGATLTGSTIGLRASNRRTGAVQTFEYRPLHNNKRVNLIVTVSGWMTGKVDDVRLPFSTVDPIMGDLYSVLWEPEMLRSMGDTINILATEALTQGLQQVLGSTVLVALMSSLQLPLVLTKLSYLIDNPWIVSLARANAAGLILADSLMERNLGKRPVTLLGFSLGARLIFSCLKELADRGAHGLVQNVYLFGSPIVANKDEYLKARGVVSGRFVNGYSSNDWILGYLFRATSGGIMRVAGLAPVEGIPGLENFDVTKLVNGHMDYRAAMPRLLKEVGWEVLGDEFAELEDPDPENHAERQRELIREIDEARREAEAKPEKKRFGLFKRGKLAQKKGWETYDVERNNATPRDSVDSNGTGSVLFDIDAIRAELASESIEVKQLESTLPPMKLDLNSPPCSAPVTPAPSDIKDTAKAVNLTKSAPQSPPKPYSAPSASHDLQPSTHKEEEIEMTFDTSYHEPPQRSHSFYEPTAAPSYDTNSTRPELQSSLTTPAGLGIGAAAGVGASALGALALEPNAWADHDIGNGEEGEISMSFE
ncbi:hypothetical protein BDV32DRAFT_120736 [Aspergillus pseudonomiae]|uniref:Uncharacterized protein n=1 Tax=Aspergillus pseudonomiae TaxID=1506151 RepID=A0A5N6I5F7_9EURO|nr:uncharacterized protein BDV37DRAFT_218098 [Aspergillus pseudonomiae]KAB8261902.1 hypothetical protein BDV32DRAFT_120736 [Aspergillus pseudonomiae]KAE8399908.1 hypothetical protein BDV37DRAFT_218098 [Aspergillus pseudonomiae]